MTDSYAESPVSREQIGFALEKRFTLEETPKAACAGRANPDVGRYKVTHPTSRDVRTRLSQSKSYDLDSLFSI